MQQQQERVGLRLVELVRLELVLELLVLLVIWLLQLGPRRQTCILKPKMKNNFPANEKNLGKNSQSSIWRLSITYSLVEKLKINIAVTEATRKTKLGLFFLTSEVKISFMVEVLGLIAENIHADNENWIQIRESPVNAKSSKEAQRLTRRCFQFQKILGIQN